MKNNSKYNEIGKLYLFKPDYLNDNKKTFLTSNIIKEYLRKRKGRYFYKVNFMKNRFKVKIQENTDIINRRLELKVIENSYKEMKSEIHKRFLDDENEKSVKLTNYNNYNCFSSRNKSRNNNLHENMCNSNISDNNISEKNIKLKKTFSPKNYNFFKTKKELNSKFIDSIRSTNMNKYKKLPPKLGKYLNDFKKNKTKIKEFPFNSNQEGNKNEINYLSFHEKGKEIQKYSSNNNILKKLGYFK